MDWVFRWQIQDYTSNPVLLLLNLAPVRIAEISALLLSRVSMPCML
jgi:hypothetical protein